MLRQCLWESNPGQTQTCLCARGPSSRPREEITKEIALRYISIIYKYFVVLDVNEHYFRLIWNYIYL